MSRVGRLKNRIEIFRPATTTDEYGGSTVTLASLGTFWASVNRLSGSRSLQYESITFGRAFRLELRQDIDLLEDDDIVYDSKTLVIAYVERDEFKKKYQILIANERYSG